MIDLYKNMLQHLRFRTCLQHFGFEWTSFKLDEVIVGGEAVPDGDERLDQLALIGRMRHSDWVSMSTLCQRFLIGFRSGASPDVVLAHTVGDHFGAMA